MALITRCYAARTGLIRLVGRLLVGMGALSDTAALGDRGTSVLERSCSAHELGEYRSETPEADGLSTPLSPPGSSNGRSQRVPSALGFGTAYGVGKSTFLRTEITTDDSQCVSMCNTQSWCDAYVFLTDASTRRSVCNYYNSKGRPYMDAREVILHNKVYAEANQYFEGQFVQQGARCRVNIDKAIIDDVNFPQLNCRRS